MNEKTTQRDDIFEVTIVYPTYTRRLKSVGAPQIVDDAGVPMLLVIEPNGKISKFNVNKIERYDY